jgi:hypothetical protein
MTHKQQNAIKQCMVKLEVLHMVNKIANINVDGFLCQTLVMQNLLVHINKLCIIFLHIQYLGHFPHWFTKELQYYMPLKISIVQALILMGNLVE